MIQINFKYLLEYGIAMYENTYEGKFNPLVRIRASASRIHGIRNEDVIDCPTFKEAAHSVREFIRDRSIVGHNVNFDKQFLSSEFRRCGVESVDRNGAFCTMSRVRELRGQAGGGWYCSNLDNTARILGVPARKHLHHDAIEDAFIASNIALELFLHDNHSGQIQNIFQLD